MAQAPTRSETPSSKGGAGGDEQGKSPKDKGNEFFKAGNYLKAAALHTQATKQDPNNPTLYSNRAAAFLHLVKLTKALSDAEATINLNPQWDKGYFRKGCALEAMERYNEALSASESSLKYNPQSSEVSKKIKKLNQLVRDRKRSQEVEDRRTNIQLSKVFDPLKNELSAKYRTEEGWEAAISFNAEIMEIAIKSWYDTSKVDPRIHFLLDQEKTDTSKYAPVVNIDKAFESPHAHRSCFHF